MKTKIVIDYVVSEDNYYIYKVLNYREVDGQCAPLWSDIYETLESGYFYDSDELDEWLETEEENIEVVIDYRKNY
jgi:hypothetical protein